MPRHRRVPRAQGERSSFSPRCATPGRLLTWAVRSGKRTPAESSSGPKTSQRETGVRRSPDFGWRPGQVDSARICPGVFLTARTVRAHSHRVRYEECGTYDGRSTRHPEGLETSAVCPMLTAPAHHAVHYSAT